MSISTSQILLSAFILFSFSYCKKESDYLHDALNHAGSNRLELEKVLAHYEDSSLKLKAASFLISNMKNLYTLDGPSMDQYYNSMDSLQKRSSQMNVFELRALSDSVIKRLHFNGLEKKFDLNRMDADYLIRRIDHAFRVREMPWAKDLSFEEFCEYLLPYRISTEVLEDWQEDLSGCFEELLNETNLQSDSAMYLFCDKLSKKYKTNLYAYPAGMPAIKPSRLKYQKIGPCEDFANLFVFIGRTFGIPSAIDFTPQWANHSQGHVWSVIVYKGKSLYYMLGEGVPRGEGEKRFTYQLTKAYRKTYGIQSNSLAVIASGEAIPPFFQNPRMKDVTEKYIPTKDLHIDNLNPYRQRGKRVYAMAFDDRNWTPVAWADIEKNNKSVIRNIGYPAIYLPVYYTDNQYVVAQYPVKFDKEGNSHYLKPEKESLQTLVLKRKFMDNRAWQFAELLKGGRFQLADNKKFSNATEYNIPDTVGYNYQTISVHDGRKYRYIRYLPEQGTSGDIAEIEVYDKENNLINGEIMGTYNYANDTIHGMWRVFDGKALTYALCDKTRTDQWVGLDMGKPIEVSKLLYLPRTDDNFIKDKELYELFYWDNKWVSLGKQSGDKQIQTLTYNNVPSNSLLLLRNLTKGKEERIFTYENEKQVWW